jgi:hypothetical protein
MKTLGYIQLDVTNFDIAKPPVINIKNTSTKAPLQICQVKVCSDIEYYIWILNGMRPFSNKHLLQWQLVMKMANSKMKHHVKWRCKEPR